MKITFLTWVSQLHCPFLQEDTLEGQERVQLGKTRWVHSTKWERDGEVLRKEEGRKEKRKGSEFQER